MAPWLKMRGPLDCNTAADVALGTFLCCEIYIPGLDVDLVLVVAGQMDWKFDVGTDGDNPLWLWCTRRVTDASRQ